MAEAYPTHFAGNKAEVYSAGIEAHGVNPKAVDIMKEDGIDISGHTSNKIEEYAHQKSTLILTLITSLLYATTQGKNALTFLLRLSNSTRTSPIRRKPQVPQKKYRMSFAKYAT